MLESQRVLRVASSVANEANRKPRRRQALFVLIINSLVSDKKLFGKR